MQATFTSGLCSADELSLGHPDGPLRAETTIAQDIKRMDLVAVMRLASSDNTVFRAKLAEAAGTH